MSAQSFAFYSGAHSTAPPSYYSPSQPSRVQKPDHSKRPFKMIKNNKRNKVGPKMEQSVVQMDTEEDILSWIEERRRKYPTLAKRLNSQEKGDGSHTVSASGQVTINVKEQVNRQIQEQAKISSSEPRRACKNFLKGNCRYGTKCRFDHGVKPKQENPDIKPHFFLDDGKVKRLLEMLKFLQSRNYGRV